MRSFYATGRQDVHEVTRPCPHWVSQSHETRRKGRIRTPVQGPKRHTGPIKRVRLSLMVRTPAAEGPAVPTRCPHQPWAGPRSQRPGRVLWGASASSTEVESGSPEARGGDSAGETRCLLSRTPAPAHLLLPVTPPPFSLGRPVYFPRANYLPGSFPHPEL